MIDDDEGEFSYLSITLDKSKRATTCDGDYDDLTECECLLNSVNIIN